MKKQLLALLVIAMALVGMASAANYMYEKATVKILGSKISFLSRWELTERFIDREISYHS